MRNGIKKLEVVQKILYKNRFYVLLNPNPFKGKIPMAHYVWLIHNPAFIEIPKGYVIHHLDGNSLNDDISNLALMGKSHHLAYHSKYFKNNGADVPIVLGIDPFNALLGSNPSRFRYKKTNNPKAERWMVFWQEDGPKGKRIRRGLRTMNGQSLTSEDLAKEAMEHLKKIASNLG